MGDPAVRFGGLPVWQATADTTRMTWLFSLVWCVVAVGTLVFDRRL